MLTSRQPCWGHHPACAGPCQLMIFEWPLPCLRNRVVSEMEGSLSLDGQVLVIVFFAIR